MPKTAQQILNENNLNIDNLQNLLSANAYIALDNEEAERALIGQVEALAKLKTAFIQQNEERMTEQLEILAGMERVLRMPAGANGRTVYQVLCDALGEEAAAFDAAYNQFAEDLELPTNANYLHDGLLVPEPWNQKQLRAAFEHDQLYLFGTEFLTNKNFRQRDRRRDDEIINEAQQEEDISKSNRMKLRMNGFRREANRTFGVNEVVSQANVIGTEEGAALLVEKQGELAAALRNEGTRRTNPKVRRFYEEMGYIVDPANGNFTQVSFQSPYLKSVFNSSTKLLNPAGADSDDVITDVGRPFFNACYDYNHSIADEFRTQYLRQQMEADGPWDGQKEERYLRELKNTHEQFLRSHDRLSQFEDDPQSRRGKHVQNTMEEFFGRTPGPNRGIAPYTGMMRGELAAIENGWGSKELSILGAVGAMEEELRRYEKYGNPEEKEEIARFRDDLTKLKADCWFERVDSAESRKRIADEVKSFIDSHNTEVAQNIMSVVRLSRNAFDSACNEIDTAAERENTMQVKPGDLKKNDPVAYLRALELKAVESGDFSIYVAEYVDVNHNRDHHYTAEQENALEAYYEEISARGDEDPDRDPEQAEANKHFLREFGKAFAAYYQKVVVTGTQAADHMAEAVRSGREQVHPALEGIKEDEEASRTIAVQKLANTPLGKRMEMVTAAQISVSQLYEGQYFPLVEPVVNDYINNGTDALTREERRHFQRRGQGEFNDSLDEFGILQNGQLPAEATGEKKLTEDPNQQKMLTRLTRNRNKTEQYYEDMEKMRSLASEKLRELKEYQAARPTAKWDRQRRQYVNVITGETVNPKKANSPEFMGMVTALEKVAGLGPDNTPLEVERALSALDRASREYEEKIRAQGRGAAFWSNGRNRLRMAGELQTFAKQQEEALFSSGRTVVTLNAPIVDQVLRVQANEAAQKSKVDLLAQDQANNDQAQNQANNNQAQNQGNNNPVQNQVNNNDPVQNAANDAQQQKYIQYDSLKDFEQAHRPKNQEESEIKERKRSNSVRQKNNNLQHNNQQQGPALHGQNID